MKSRMIVTMAVLALTAALSGSTVAQQGPGYGPGPGSGPGYGYGPGMMGGYGPGMMGGYGGMTAGYGPGWARGGYGPGGFAALNLSDEQREKIAKIQEENRSKNWNTMGQMRGEMFKLRQMYFGDKLDSNAISEQQRKVDELRVQMVKSRVEARNQVSAVLTPEQRQQFRSFGPWGADETID